MNVDVRALAGPWNLGYSLDRHTESSTYIGNDQFGHPRFDTKRTPTGEALYLLKYRGDASQIVLLGNQLALSLGEYFASASVVVPMPPSRRRALQPVVEIAKDLAKRMNIPCREDLLIKVNSTKQMKDIPNRADKVAALLGALVVKDVLSEGCKHDVLVVDDLFDSGASVEAATLALRDYPKVGNVYVATCTRKY